ncbi:MAG: hypothetical protein ACXWD8_07935 [Mycobacterium sp.]
MAAELTTPALATVAADPATAVLATVAADPATAELAVVDTDPATAVLAVVVSGSTTLLSWSKVSGTASILSEGRCVVSRSLSEDKPRAQRYVGASACRGVCLGQAGGRRIVSEGRVIDGMCRPADA